MDREEILQKKLETLEELEKIGEMEKGEQGSGIMSLIFRDLRGLSWNQLWKG